MFLARNKYTPNFIIATLLSAMSSGTMADDASDRADWTMGLGLGFFDYHLYPGADQTNQYVLPVPYFTYTSKKFEIDRGVKSFLYHSETMVVDVSADFGLPVDSDEARARTGMPDLDFMLQLGPSIEFFLNDRKQSYFDARFEVPLRIAITTDFHSVEGIGYELEPRFSFNHRRPGDIGISHKITLGIKLATQDFHAYYYNVDEEFATAQRPEYSSSSGYGGSFAKYRISYKRDDFVYWLFARYQSLSGAVFEDSPLVLQKDYYFLGVGFSWIFANSI